MSRVRLVGELVLGAVTTTSIVSAKKKCLNLMDTLESQREEEKIYAPEK
jgi:hypothetical protein